MWHPGVSDRHGRPYAGTTDYDPVICAPRQDKHVWIVPPRRATFKPMTTVPQATTRSSRRHYVRAYRRGATDNTPAETTKAPRLHQGLARDTNGLPHAGATVWVIEKANLTFFRTREASANQCTIVLPEQVPEWSRNNGHKIRDHGFRVQRRPMRTDLAGLEYPRNKIMTCHLQ